MKKQTETRTIDGIEYKVLLRRVPEKGKSIVGNRRETKTNGAHEKTATNKKITKEKSKSPNNGKSPTRKIK